MHATAMPGAAFPQHPRYEITALLGTGDFAAVYRARDRELGREVAIKQIHQQYLNDPRRLERFWREAQLLASLEHPHIMTIYDIVRSHGWLVLELMQGTLLDATRGQPIDLNLLRGSLSAALSGLSLLHSRGTLHGDIKPSNLLIDRLGRIKLGDFGLARRVASDQGSYLKGATRYMAPEMAAPQFGPVGPASDLYSLGFTAYELLCGTQPFELLFPGLDAFGRDKQVAWMMWHAAPDRRLPPIDSVLGGVPEDLARVIQRLTIKDQTHRYRSADQALADLAPAGEVTTHLGNEAEDEAAARRATFQRRAVSIGALAASVLLCSVILFFPTTKKKPPAPKPDIVVRGVVRSILPERQTLIVEDAVSSAPREFQLSPDAPILLNEQATLLRDLAELDQVAVIIKHDEQGKQHIEVHAARPRGDAGTVTQVRHDVGTLGVKLAADGEELTVQVPPSCPIELNGQTTVGETPLTLSNLKPGDRIILRHFAGETGETALSISARRIVAGEGVLVGIDAQKMTLTIATGSAESGNTTVFPLAERYEVLLNGRRSIDGKLLTIADLKPGDAVTFQRDVELVSISVQRQFEESGAILAIRYDVRSFTLRLADGGERTFLLQPSCRIFLGSDEVTFDDLRRGDRAEVAFSSPDAESPEAGSIVATRPADAAKWAVVVVGSAFDDSAVPPLASAADQSSRLREILSGRYAIPVEQILVLENPSRVRLEQGFADALARAGSAGQLLVVVAGRMAAGKNGAPLVAPQDFAAARADDTGAPLAPLLALVDASPAKEKIVLLDLDSTDGSAPAAADAFAKIQGTQSKPLLKSTNVLAATAGGPAGSGESKLVAALTAALAGEADANRDMLCDLTEIHDYLQRASAGQFKLFLPNDTPPRLTDDAKEAIRRLAVLAGESKVDPDQAQSLSLSARALAPQEIEPKLVAALVQLKARQYPESLAQLREVLILKPAVPIAWEASAWAKFERRAYLEGLADLVQLLKHLPSDPAAAGAEGRERVLPWIGRLREYCAQALPADRKPPAAALAALDAAIAARSNEDKRLMAEGRDAVRAVLAEFDARLAATTDTNEQVQLRYERWQLRHHASLSPEALVQQVLARLDD